MIFSDNSSLFHAIFLKLYKLLYKYGALINLIVIVFAGVSLGANVLISEAKGAGNHEKAEKILHTSLLFALITGVFVGVLGFFISDDLLGLMGTEEHYFTNAALYLKIFLS